MTEEKLLKLINTALEEIKDEGVSASGKIELIIRDGDVKHVNVTYEMNLSTRKRYFHPTIPSEKGENQV